MDALAPSCKRRGHDEAPQPRRPCRSPVEGAFGNPPDDGRCGAPPGCLPKPTRRATAGGGVASAAAYRVPPQTHPTGAQGGKRSRCTHMRAQGHELDKCVDPDLDAPRCALSARRQSSRQYDCKSIGPTTVRARTVLRHRDILVARQPVNAREARNIAATVVCGARDLQREGRHRMAPWAGRLLPTY